MPIIAQFYGILIRMYFQDHAPPHFHAIYAEYEASIEIATGDILDGKLPATARRLVREWTSMRKEELIGNWLRAQNGGTLERLAGPDVEQGD